MAHVALAVGVVVACARGSRTFTAGVVGGFAAGWIAVVGAVSSMIAAGL